MSQLTQAMDVVKELSKLKVQLIKHQVELKSILAEVQSKNSDDSITPAQWHALNYVRHRIDEFSIAFDKLDIRK